MVWACFPTADTFEPLRSAWAKPAPSSLITPCPWNVASSKSPYVRCAPLRSSSWVAAPSVVWLHAIGQLLSPAGRCLSISTVHGGAGGGDGGGAGLDVVASVSTLVARRSTEMRSVPGFIVWLDVSAHQGRWRIGRVLVEQCTVSLRGVVQRSSARGADEWRSWVPRRAVGGGVGGGARQRLRRLRR